MPLSRLRRVSVGARFAGPGDSEGMVLACYGPGASREQPRPFDKTVAYPAEGRQSTLPFHRAG